MSKKIDSVENQIINIKEHFKKLGKIWNECLNAMNALDSEIDINSLICGYENQYTYPFDKSFDEIPMDKWIKSISFMCDAKIKERNNKQD